jgi:hypothetical protein
MNILKNILLKKKYLSNPLNILLVCLKNRLYKFSLNTREVLWNFDNFND